MRFHLQEANRGVVRYVVNQGKEPPKNTNPVVREGYKEVFFYNGIAETDDTETIEYLRAHGFPSDAEVAAQKPQYTQDDLERMLAANEKKFLAKLEAQKREDTVQVPLEAKDKAKGRAKKPTAKKPRAKKAKGTTTAAKVAVGY